MSSVIICRNESVSQTEIMAELHAPWFLGQHQVWAAFNYEISDSFRGDFPAEMWSTFDKRILNLLIVVSGFLLQIKRGRQTRNPATDNSDMKHIQPREHKL
jgi:hypothetical protein